MNQKLADQLIEHYEKAVARINATEDSDDVLVILNEMKVRNGLCFCAKHVFGAYIYDDEWIESKFMYGYRGSTPYDKNTTVEILTSLQTRIDILKTFK